MMGEGGAVPSPGLQRLLQAIRDYRPAEGGEELVALRHAIDLLELKFSVHSGQYAESMEWDRQGYRTPVEFFRYEAHMPSGIAADRVDVGLQYENLERSVDAVAKGEIGFAHLAAMARTAEWLEQRDRDFDESWLLDKARTLTVTRFRRACEHLRHRQDPKEFAREEQEAHERRFLELSPAEDGSLWLRGMLDPEGAAVMRSALEPLARPLDRHDDRPRPQRLADALVEALSSNQETELLITCPLETLMGLEGAPAAETEWGGLLSRYAVERLACSSALRRVVIDSKSVVIDMGRKERVITERQRKALIARDGCCAAPGCDRPPRYSAGHHLIPWSEGSGTDLQELALVCWHHHRRIHHNGWQLARNQDGTYRMIPPIPPSWPLDPPAA